MKKLLTIFVLLLTILFIPAIVDATYTPDKQHSVIKKGDIIYFDAKDLNWDKVYIHLWEKDGAIYKDWFNDDEMTKVNGTDNIYMFIVPDDIDEIYNMVIFKNGIDGNENQTIDLGYIEEKYGYIIDNMSEGKRIGYWYLYDKSNLREKLDALKEYQNDKEYYTSISYSNLDEIITNIENKLESEIRLEEDSSNPGMFYVQVDYDFDSANDIINLLVVDSTLLEELIQQEENNLSDYEQNYTKNSVDNLKTVLNEKKELLNNNITVDDIKTGISDINDAKDALVSQVDKIKLKKILDDIGKIDREKYTDDSLKTLDNLLNHANELLNDTNILQSDIDEMVESLKSARNNLKEKESNILEDVKVNSPRTLDNIVKIFMILGGSVVLLIVILTILKKMKKDN